MRPSVLIVGAGPTGLMLALWLKRLGVSFRIIDGRSGPGEASRALVVQARILEFYRQLGLAEAIVPLGIKMQRLHFEETGSEKGCVEIGEIGTGISPYPFMLTLPQDDHERFLVDQLNLLDVKIEWNNELLAFTQNENVVSAQLTNETLECDFLCGCDGSHSRVRECLKLEFPGGTYQQRFFVADVLMENPLLDLDMHGSLNKDGFVIRMPVRSSGAQRIIGIVPPGLGDDASITFDSVRPTVENLIAMKVREINWFSTYHVHHRVVEQFRSGRAFLLGDAAHIHSPAGGQGMNTGMGDAVNLSWKLAEVLKGAHDGLLDTYDAERHAFAKLLVNSTDRAFQTMVNPSKLGEIFRTVLVPHLMPFMFGFTAVRRAAFNVVSQTRIDYHDSALSAGTAGSYHGGNRLPWVPYLDGDNFAALTELDWQIHVYGVPTPNLTQWAQDSKIPLHVFPVNPLSDHADIAPDCAFLIRPDGYISVASSAQDPTAFASMLERFGIHR